MRKYNHKTEVYGSIFDSTSKNIGKGLSTTFVEQKVDAKNVITVVSRFTDVF